MAYISICAWFFLEPEAALCLVGMPLTTTTIQNEAQYLLRLPEGLHTEFERMAGLPRQLDAVG